MSTALLESLQPAHRLETLNGQNARCECGLLLNWRLREEMHSEHVIELIEDDARRSALSWMADEVRQVNEEHGWYPNDNTFGDYIALLHSEVSEALEAYRQWGTADAAEDQCLHDHDTELPTHLCKPEGVGSELADVLIRLLDIAKAYDVDLEAEYERKITYNRVRAYRHGGKRL